MVTALVTRVPSLQALLAAILIDTLTKMTDLAIRARQEPDPWTAFAGFAEADVQLRASSCGVVKAFTHIQAPRITTAGKAAGTPGRVALSASSDLPEAWNS
ncbi:hypothetical protein ACBJ59_57415 [Nonomuraea sp. MTCD27]|uniref:hypothetical protein n=1 Tax=Nonomuraea sp. MTCD27 TaxID=1676747 RepID=UPI0035BED019